MQYSRTPVRSNSFKKPGFHGIAFALTIAAAFGEWACGASPTSSSSPPPPLSIVVTVTPNAVTVLRDATHSFTAKVTGTSKTTVTWSVEESSGGEVNVARKGSLQNKPQGAECWMQKKGAQLPPPSPAPHPRLIGVSATCEKRGHFY